MLKTWMAWTAALLVLLLTGCAHPVSLTPDAAALAKSGATKLDRKVGLVVSDEQRRLELTTAGGGGDKVSYFPYRDLEPWLYMALSETFSSVSRLSGPQDPKLQSEGLAYLVVPVVSTTSYSPSLLTWPPTVFTVELNLSFNDPRNKNVVQVRVQGEGRAEFDEFKRDVSLAPKRASEDALKKLVKAIADVADRLR